MIDTFELYLRITKQQKLELQDAIKALTIQAQRIADIETNDMYNKMVSEGILEDLKDDLNSKHLYFNRDLIEVQ